MSSSYSTHFMGMPRWHLYNPEYAQASQLPQSIPVNVWWPQYSKALYILSQTFEASDQQDMQAMKTFILCLFQLIPDPQFRAYFKDFLEMKEWVVSILTHTAPNLFLAYSGLEHTLKSKPNQFFMESMQNKDNEALLIWVYLLNVFVVGIINQINQQRQLNRQLLLPSVHLPSLNEVRSMFNKHNLKIYDWGHPMWFIIHSTSLYAPQPINQSFMYYSMMLQCLTKLLPCEKCREHLTQNLHYIDFKNCPKTPEHLFKCGWQLHNIVNQSTNKPSPTFQQAMSMYTFI